MALLASVAVFFKVSSLGARFRPAINALWNRRGEDVTNDECGEWGQLSPLFMLTLRNPLRVEASKKQLKTSPAGNDQPMTFTIE